MPFPTFRFAALGAVFVLLPQIALAQNGTSYISSTGSDANICNNPTNACRFLQRAHDQTVPGGNIFILDSGTFAGSGLVITQSINITAVGIQAQLAGTGVADKIVINAGANDVIQLQGLYLFGTDKVNEDYGIRFNSGGRLHVRNSLIRGFGAAGIFVRGGGTKQVFISDSTITNNQQGILVRPAGTGRSTVQLERVNIEGNLSAGIRAVGSKAVVRVSNSAITNNNRGLAVSNNGKIVSFGNNVIIDNNIDGAPTATTTLK